MKIRATIAKEGDKMGSKICQIQKKPPNNCQIIIFCQNFAKSDHTGCLRKDKWENDKDKDQFCSRCYKTFFGGDLNSPKIKKLKKVCYND